MVFKCLKKVQGRFKISGHDAFKHFYAQCSEDYRYCLKASGKGTEHLLLCLLVYSKVLLWLQRRSVHNIRLCHRLASRIVRPLVIRGALCAQHIHILWDSECMLAGCMYRGMSTKPVHNFVHHSEPGFSEPSCVSTVS